MKKIYMMMLLVMAGTMAMAQTSVWHGGRQIWIHGEGTENSPYLIESAENLAFLAYMVNKGYETYDLYFRLTTDIDLNGSEDLQWVPIGMGNRWFSEDGCDRGIPSGSGFSPMTIFRGHFDGGDHSISNIYIDNSEGIYGSNIGLFGNATGVRGEQEIYPAVIENVFVTSGYIKGFCCGGIVGDGGGMTTVSRCWNGATIEGSPNSRCGGIVGNNAYRVNNCYNLGAITGYYVGGIVGFGPVDIIEECYNEGDISGTYAGGIYGFSMRKRVGINNCYNKGTIEASGEGMSNYPAGPAAGGIASFLSGTTSVTNCYNVGNVSSTQDAGCILAFGPEETFANNYYINTCGAGGEGVASEEDYMRTQEFVDALNAGNRDPIWKMDENNVNDGFPILVKIDLEVLESSENTFNVYPNPAQGQFTVEGSGMVIVRNLLGQTLLTRQIDGQTVINLPQGMYFVTLGNTTQKVLVK